MKIGNETVVQLQTNAMYFHPAGYAFHVMEGGRIAVVVGGILKYSSRGSGTKTLHTNFDEKTTDKTIMPVPEGVWFTEGRDSFGLFKISESTVKIIYKLYPQTP